MVLEVTDENILSLFNVPKLYIGRAISAEQDLPALPGLEPIIWYRPFSRTDCMAVSDSCLCNRLPFSRKSSLAKQALHVHFYHCEQAVFNSGLSAFYIQVPTNEKDHVRAMIRRFKGHIATDRRCSFPRLVAAALDLQKNNSKSGFKIVHFSIKVAIPGSKRYCLETTSAEFGAWEYISDLQPTRTNAENVGLQITPGCHGDIPVEQLTCDDPNVPL